MPGWRTARSQGGSALMSFALALHPEALREWRRLTSGVWEQFKKKLAERLIEPRIPASRMRGCIDRTKIKLRAAGFRPGPIRSLSR